MELRRPKPGVMRWKSSGYRRGARTIFPGNMEFWFDLPPDEETEPMKVLARLASGEVSREKTLAIGVAVSTRRLHGGETRKRLGLTQLEARRDQLLRLEREYQDCLKRGVPSTVALESLRLFGAYDLSDVDTLLAKAHALRTSTELLHEGEVLSMPRWKIRYYPKVKANPSGENKMWFARKNMAGRPKRRGLQYIPVSKGFETFAQMSVDDLESAGTPEAMAELDRRMRSRKLRAAQYTADPSLLRKKGKKGSKAKSAARTYESSGFTVRKVGDHFCIYFPNGQDTGRYALSQAKAVAIAAKLDPSTGKRRKPTWMAAWLKAQGRGNPFRW